MIINNMYVYVYTCFKKWEEICIGMNLTIY